MEVFRTAIRSLLSNRTRSVLTMLGIIIGVGAVITMLAIGNGASLTLADSEAIAEEGFSVLRTTPEVSGTAQQFLGITTGTQA